MTDLSDQCLIRSQRSSRAKLPAFLLDMDGVLYHGDRVIPAAVAFLAAIEGHKRLLITNNPSRTPAVIAEHLKQLGFKGIGADDILTSAQATARWLVERKPDFRYYAVGAEGLHIALSEVGQAATEQVDYVVIGEGPGLDFDSLSLGINLLADGAELICTNPDNNVDATLNGRRRILPGGGALVAPFAVASGCTPTYIGKPAPLLYRMAQEQLKVAAQDCIMIGDRPDTDILGAVNAGMKSCLVRTGRFEKNSRWPNNLPTPNWDIDSLGDFPFELIADDYDNPK